MLYRYKYYEFHVATQRFNFFWYKSILCSTRSSWTKLATAFPSSNNNGAVRTSLQQSQPNSQLRPENIRRRWPLSEKVLSAGAVPELSLSEEQFQPTELLSDKNKSRPNGLFIHRPQHLRSLRHQRNEQPNGTRPLEDGERRRCKPLDTAQQWRRRWQWRVLVRSRRRRENSALHDLSQLGHDLHDPPRQNGDGPQHRHELRAGIQWKWWEERPHFRGKSRGAVLVVCFGPEIVEAERRVYFDQNSCETQLIFDL